MQTKRRRRTGDGETQGILRTIPAVSRIQATREFARLARETGEALATSLVREAIAAVRDRVLEGRLNESLLRSVVRPSAIVARATREAEQLLRPSPRLVINATGVVVHTNLGRSVLSRDAAARVAEAMTAYLDLEFDLEKSVRGSRLGHLEPLLGRLFPGHAFAAFNNNAAAILITLRALARGKEVIVSRGELVEIGGSFRVPDILSASGARLREVGTTNRTRLRDYEDALGSRTALLLKVHTSNFRIVGFSEETSVRDLAALARRAEIPLVVDWGSGDLVDLVPLGIRDEIPVGSLLAEGADVVTFSADKLLGGPQAGIIVGRGDLLAKIRKDPLARVCRLDRLLICALRETLAAYVRGRAMDQIPTLRMIALDPDEIEARAETVRRTVLRRVDAGSHLDLVDGVSRTGGGSSPVGERPTRLLSLGIESGDAGRIERFLREGEPAILGRLHEGKLLLDLRTVLPSQDSTLARRVAEALRAYAAVRNSKSSRGGRVRR